MRHKKNSYQSATKIRALKSTALLSFAMLVSSFVATAQENTATETQDEDDTFVAETVYVTARRKEERLQDAPVAATVLSGEALRRYNLTDLQKIAQSVPQLMISKGSTGGGNAIYLRGIGSAPNSTGFDQSVSVNVDGVQVSRGRAATQSYFDLSQVEVLRGPQALFFGKNSPAGIITMTTANPGNTFEAEALTGYDWEQDKIYGEAVVSGPISETLGARLAIRASSLDGPFTNQARAQSFGPLDAVIGAAPDPRDLDLPKEEEILGRLTLAFQPSDQIEFILKSNFASLENSGPSSVVQITSCQANDGDPAPVFGVPFLTDPYSDCKINNTVSRGSMNRDIALGFPGAKDGHPYQEWDSQIHSLTGNVDIGDLTLTSITGYYSYDTTLFDNFDRSSVGVIYATEAEKYDSLTEEVRLSTNWSGPLNLMIGAFVQDASMDFNNISRVAPHGADPATGNTNTWTKPSRTDHTAYSLFTEASFDLTTTLEVSGGVRWTREEKDFWIYNSYVHPFGLGIGVLTDRFSGNFKDENLSPQATLRWTPSTNTTVYGSYKEGYKSGGFNNSVLLRGAVTIDDIRFGSETVSGFEFGWKQQLPSSGLVFDVTLFDYTYEDLQVNQFNSDALAFFVDNAGKSITRGVEFQSTWRPVNVDGLALRSAIAYNDAYYDEYVGDCFTGQTVSQGCDQSFAAGAFRAQDYKDRTLPRAPEWVGSVGATLIKPVGANWEVTYAADARYSGEYNYVDNLRPDGVQDAFWLVDAGLSLGSRDGRWTASLIGRNLFDEITIQGGQDRSGTGSGSGTTAGIPADVVAFTSPGREMAVQLKYRFW